MEFSGYITRSETTGPYGHYCFKFVQSLHSDFHTGCINLHSSE